MGTAEVVLSPRAAFGSVMEPLVTILREFCDKFLMANRLGNIFIKMYYTYSPDLADFIVTHDRLLAMVRLSLITGCGHKLGGVNTWSHLFRVALGFGRLFDHLLFYRMVWKKKTVIKKFGQKTVKH